MAGRKAALSLSLTKVFTKIDSVEDVEEQMTDAGGAENEKIFRRD